MDLESECEQLLNYFGDGNIRIEYLDDTDDINFDAPDLLNNLSKFFSKVQVTHIPTGKVCNGTKFQTQLENVVYALKEMKMQMKET